MEGWTEDGARTVREWRRKAPGQGVDDEPADAYEEQA